FTGKKANGDVAIYKKRFTGLMPNTVYYLRLQGMGLGDVISDADFGFMDTEYGKELQNPLNEARATTAAYRATFKQRNNFQCQDGSWYTRVYEFNTENNTELDFFIRGTRGTVYYDNIKLFKQSDAYTLSSDGKVQPMAVLEYSEENFACKVKDNLIENWDFSKGTKFWENFKGFGNFVEVATSEDNNMLHFKGNDLAYYYLPWVDVKANVTYTFSFWKKNLNGESSRSVLVSEYNPHGYASEIYSVAEKYGEWELISVKFVCHENNRVALGVYDRDGEAVFDNVRFFESSKGYAVSKAKDMPVGGDKFSYTLLGSDGVTVVDKPSAADDSADDYDDEFIDDILVVDEEELPEEDTIQEVVTKRRKKVFLAGSGIPTWGIVLIGVGALAVLTGGVFLFLFLKKKKKRKE
ncbi:MAG: hypothetical protein J6T73_00090, partial [Clostridia bacterium]|nr:hypothetical protein [Clostridia bacterium]